MIESGLSIPDRIKHLIETEMAEFNVTSEVGLATLYAFRAALCEPEAVTVNFSGGLTQECWAVTHPNGDYRVIYLPLAGYFSLCVDSVFGPLDIGVHGHAIGCFSSV
ncbi:hypothetical protein PXK00_09150 [Phaeobacter sp. QD34_3]|uniref:hypothetical protein n=1 Tax=unclassified Phaeobacter TaxID=2621772 RepID=UPI00237F17D3|nr:MULTISPECIES: hypothetical protein [unclassified Phaeobacter]MDE4133278.1 hypothetical protein [Phaeobacter sp. QD34_3]MDE4136935.1 hypothetical protein [Phaeobacter sp. QD34_24]MDE4172775.1 hypothetical protein [Phaeobacter sp. PT47_59]